MHPLLKSTFKLSSSNLVTFIAVFILTPIISRIYTPEIYSGWGVFSNVCVIFDIIIFLSYHNAIIQTKEESEVTSLSVLCICCALLVNFSVTLFFLLGKWLGISFFVDFPSISLLSLYFLLYCAYYLSIAHANRYALYGLMATVTVVYGLSQPLLRIVLGYVYLSDISLIYACLIALFVSTICYLVGFKKKGLSLCGKRISVRDVFSIAKKYKKYPLYDAPASVMDSFSAGIVIIILSMFFEKKDIGGLSMVMQLIILPTSIVGNALAQVVFRELSVAVGDNTSEKTLAIKSAKIAFFLSCLAAFFFIFGGDWVVQLFLGEKWNNTGPMVLCMSIFAFPTIISEALVPIFKVYNRQETRLKFVSVNLMVTLSSLFIGVLVFDNFLYVIILYALGRAIVRFFQLYGELKIANLKLRDIHRYFTLSAVICYVLLSIRIMANILL